MADQKLNLKVGDILLYYNKDNWISKAIRFFDGTDLSHASLYYGQDMIAEASIEGVVLDTYEKSTKSADWIKIMRLKNPVAKMDPVIKVANMYLDNHERYGFEQLILLAMICSCRRVKVTGLLKLFIGPLLEAAADMLLKLVAAGKEPLICSEFVYRCYDEALPEKGDVYSIDTTVTLTRSLSANRCIILGSDPQSLLGYFTANPPSENDLNIRSRASHEHDLKELEKAFNEYYVDMQDEPERDAEFYHSMEKPFVAFSNALYSSVHLDNKTKASPTRIVTWKDTVDCFNSVNPNFVTPGDLYKSESLACIGRIDLKP